MLDGSVIRGLFGKKDFHRIEVGIKDYFTSRREFVQLKWALCHSSRANNIHIKYPL
jgi:hypothetical protein